MQPLRINKTAFTDFKCSISADQITLRIM